MTLGASQLQFLPKPHKKVSPWRKPLQHPVFSDDERKRDAASVSGTIVPFLSFARADFLF